jgi:hypothetical protein
VTEHPPNDIEKVLNYYGSQIPDGIGRPARRHGNSKRVGEYPKRVAELVECDGREIGSGSVTVRKPYEDLDGLLVAYDSEGDGDVEYWPMPEDVYGALVRRLTENTNLVVEWEYTSVLTCDSDGGDDDDGDGDGGDAIATMAITGTSPGESVGPYQVRGFDWHPA